MTATQRTAAARTIQAIFGKYGIARPEQAGSVTLRRILTEADHDAYTAARATLVGTTDTRRWVPAAQVATLQSSDMSSPGYRYYRALMRLDRRVR